MLRLRTGSSFPGSPASVPGWWRTMVAGLAVSVALLGAVTVSAQGSDTVYLPLSLRNAVSGMQPDPGNPGNPGPGAGKSSKTLIEEAEKAGTITHEQALVYEVFALFGDSRLPAQFRTSVPAVDSRVLAHVRDEWAGLSPQARADLLPFLLPPNAPGSWHELTTVGVQAGLQAQAVEWRWVVSASGVKVWYQTRYQGDDAKAAGVAAAIDSVIKPKLDEVMDRPWMTDGGQPTNGGDERLDIYLIRGVQYDGLTTPYAGCETTPAFILLNSELPLGGATKVGLVQIAAHEMLHAVQLAYPLKEACSTYDWLSEASAVWFEHATYPKAQSEHITAPFFLETAHLPLEDKTGSRYYGAYLYLLSVTKTRDSDIAVGRMWENAGSMSSLQAVNDVAPFDPLWSNFVLYNWNQGPHTEYRTWDNMTHTVKPLNPAQDLAGHPAVTRVLMPVTLEHLSAQYFHFRFTDSNVRSVMFLNGLTHDLALESGPTQNKSLGGSILPRHQRAGHVLARGRVELAR